MTRKLLLFTILLISSCGGHTVYFGTYSGEVLSAEFRNGTLQEVSSVATIQNPSYLAVDGDDLYAVSETDSFPSLHLIGSCTAPTLSAGPCHVAIGNGYALVSNYSGGALSIFNLPLDGSEPLTVIPGSVQGPDSIRQCTPHVHCAQFSPSGQHILASDFSADRLMSLTIGPDNCIATDRVYDLPRDTGPRHILFGSDSIVYVIGELSGNIIVMDFPSGHILQEIEADPAHTRASADIRISPDKRHLYASNRLGMDGVAIFDILPDGTLCQTGYMRTAACPRNIAISPDGKYLLVASQTENIIEIYPIDAESGLLSPVSGALSINSPVCIVFSK